jgi:hypothetical protein
MHALLCHNLMCHACDVLVSSYGLLLCRTSSVVALLACHTQEAQEGYLPACPPTNMPVLDGSTMHIHRLRSRYTAAASSATLASGFTCRPKSQNDVWQCQLEAFVEVQVAIHREPTTMLCLDCIMSTFHCDFGVIDGQPQCDGRDL